MYRAGIILGILVVIKINRSFPKNNLSHKFTGAHTMPAR